MKRRPKFRSSKQERAWLRSQGRKIKSRKSRQAHLRGLAALMKFDTLMKRIKN